MIFQRITKVVSILGCLVLGGCTGSTYSSHFDCPYGTGAGCASLSKVNKMIDRHEINLDEDDPLNKCSTDCFGTCAPQKKQVYIYYGPDSQAKIISVDESPVRQEGDNA